MKSLAGIVLAAAACLLLQHNHLHANPYWQLQATIIAPPDTTDTLKVGCATIIQSRSISNLVKKQIAHNEAQKTVDGYRIEIFSGSGNDGKIQAGSTRTAFLKTYPKMGAYLSFTQPNYAIHVGDFKERIDAIRFLQKIKDDYPEAIVVRAKVMK